MYVYVVCVCVVCVCAESFQDAGVIEAAYELNNPLTVLDLEVPQNLADVTSYFSVDTAQVVLDTVKLVRNTVLFICVLYEHNSM